MKEREVILKKYRLNEADIEKTETYIKLNLPDERTIELSKDMVKDDFFRHFNYGEIQVAWAPKYTTYEAVFNNGMRVFPK